MKKQPNGDLVLSPTDQQSLASIIDIMQQAQVLEREDECDDVDVSSEIAFTEEFTTIHYNRGTS
jgi:hypothetical protein